MGQTNVFLREADYYCRDISPISQYIDQTSFYLSRMTGRPVDEFKEKLKEKISTKTLPGMRDPVVHHFERDDNGDRYEKYQPLSRYIRSAVSENLILVPTGTCYLNPNQKKSHLASFIDINKRRRSKAKKEAQAAKARKQNDLFIIKNNEQTNMKLFNNSMSGAFATLGSILHNPTGHNTLTSVTRTVSSIGNALNEKIISGNRHYHNPEVTLNNLICIAESIDAEEIKTVMDQYGLYYPTVSDVMETIHYSSDLYWRDKKAMANVRTFVEKLSAIERAAVVYSSDLYHLRKYNEEFIRVFLDQLSRRMPATPIENPIDVIYSVDEQFINVAHIICMGITKGKGKDYEGKFTQEELYILANTCKNIEHTILMYKDLISAFFLTRVLPASTASIPNMVRRAVVLSDTDSTMFAIDEYVIWRFGKLLFDEPSYALSASVMLLSTQCISHSLALLSANMGVSKEKMFVLSMKPEFAFGPFAQTSVAKHYFTCTLVKEGNVYEDPEMEIKGVYLKNSAAPKAIIDEAQAKMEAILQSVMQGETISMREMLNWVSGIERRITNGLYSGDLTLYKQSKIKTPEAYSLPENQSPYAYHIFWEEVFAPKYGKIEPPPYSVIKIPTKLDNPTKFADWVNTLRDKDLQARIVQWAKKNNKTTLPTIYLSVPYISAFGIPEEIIPIINVKKIVLDLTITHRMMLETIGYYPKTGWLINELVL